jgi:hypothetical protein
MSLREIDATSSPFLGAVQIFSSAAQLAVVASVV